MKNGSKRDREKQDDLKQDSGMPETVKPKKAKPEESAFARFSRQNPVPYMTLTLLILSAVVAFALGFVNAQTAPVIADLQARQLVESVSKVLPGATDSAPLTGFTFASTVRSAREAFDSAGNPLGYAIEVAPTGFGGAIRMLVGVSAEGIVTGVTVLEMKETPNLGTKTRGEEWLEQFIGKDHTFKMGQDVQAITGATVSSKAVSAGVSAAIAAVLQITQGGGA